MNLPQIQNIVCTFNVGTRLNLKDIALRARNVEYNPKRFSAAIMRIRDPKTTSLIFSTGKIVVAGSKTVDLARIACRRFARILQKLNMNVIFKDFTVQNVVGSYDHKKPLRLEIMYAEVIQFASYEPELFPGLIYRFAGSRVVILVFTSGKMVITGAKTVDAIYNAHKTFYPLLVKYEKCNIK